MSVRTSTNPVNNDRGPRAARGTAGKYQKPVFNSSPQLSRPAGRRPRTPVTVNTLCTDDGPGVAAADEPEFVASKYHRAIGDDQPGTYCPDWVALATGGSKAEYLVLAQIAYWFANTKKGTLKVRDHRDGYWWLYKTHRQLAKDTRVLTPGEVRWAVRSLVRKRLLVIRHDPAGGKPKLYRIATACVEAAVEAAERRRDEVFAG
jgi:hypothetical protein